MLVVRRGEETTITVRRGSPEGQVGVEPGVPHPNIMDTYGQACKVSARYGIPQMAAGELGPVKGSRGSGGRKMQFIQTMLGMGAAIPGDIGIGIGRGGAGMSGGELWGCDLASKGVGLFLSR
jgi:hypothetical protein